MGRGGDETWEPLVGVFRSLCVRGRCRARRSRWDGWMEGVGAYENNTQLTPDNNKIYCRPFMPNSHVARSLSSTRAPASGRNNRSTIKFVVVCLTV